MPGFIADGKPMQTPQAAYNAEFLNEPSTTGEAISAEGTAESTTGFIGRLAAQESAKLTQDKSERWIDLPQLEQPKPQISADEANKKYAPIGPDGKPVKIADTPMDEDTAKYLGESKAKQIDAEGVLSRYTNNHSFVTNFGVGLAGFIQDPVNVASLFTPGLGEERALALVGKTGLETSGAIARTGARILSGATAGIAGQTPLVAAKLAESSSDPSGDYGLRSAFQDMMYGAAGGAIIHAGIFGGAREAGILKPDWLMKEGGKISAPDLQGEAANIINADAVTKNTAMKSAISQMVTGREVDVDPFFEKPYKMQAGGEAVKPSDTLLSAANAEPTTAAQDAEVKRGKDMEQWIALRKQVEELPESDNPDELRRQEGLKRRVQKLGDRLGDKQPQDIADLAQKQQQIYRDGYAPGMTSLELEKAHDEVLGEKPTEEQTKIQAKGAEPALFSEQEALQNRLASYGEWIRELSAKHQAEAGPHDEEIAALKEGKSPRQVKLVQDKIDALEEKNKAWKSQETPDMKRLREENESIRGRLKEMIPDVYNTLERARQHLESHPEHAERTPAGHEEESADTIKDERRQIAEQHLPEEYNAIVKGTEETSGRKTGTGESTGSGRTAAVTREGGVIAGAGEVGTGGGEAAGKGIGKSGAVKPTGTESGGRTFPQDAEITALRAKLNPAIMTGEERAQLLGAAKSTTDADAWRKGYEAAADCLSGEGV